MTTPNKRTIHKWYHILFGIFALVILVIFARAQEPSTNIIRSLSDPAWRVRRSACLSLSKIPNTGNAAIDSLIARLDDSDSLVRRAAALALGEKSEAGQSAIPKLIRLLDQDYVGGAAATALRKIGPQAIKPLVEITINSKEQERLRIAALRAISDFGPVARDTSQDLTALLQQKSLPTDILYEICYALGSVGSETRVTASELLTLFQRRDSLLRLRTARTLGRIGPLDSDQVRLLINALANEQRLLKEIQQQIMDANGYILPLHDRNRADWAIRDDLERSLRVQMEIVNTLSKLQRSLSRQEAQAIVLPALLKILEIPHPKRIEEFFQTPDAHDVCYQCELYIAVARSLRFYGQEARAALPLLERLVDYQAAGFEVNETIKMLRQTK